MAEKRLHTNGATGHISNKTAASTYEAHRREADGKSVLGYYAASSGNSIRTFQDNLSVTSSRVKEPPPQKKTCNFSTGFI